MGVFRVRATEFHSFFHGHIQCTSITQCTVKLIVYSAIKHTTLSPLPLVYKNNCDIVSNYMLTVWDKTKAHQNNHRRHRALDEC